jgi:hypothetical protein
MPGNCPTHRPAWSLLLVAMMIAVLIPAVSAEEIIIGDTYTIDITDNAPMTERYFPMPPTTTGNVEFASTPTISGIKALMVHRDLGDIDHIIFASHKIVKKGYDTIDIVPISLYWDDRVPDYSGFPSTIKEENCHYVGSGDIYVYSNSQTSEGHMTFRFNDWDSSIYAEHPDILIYCHIVADRNLNFSTIAMGSPASGVSTYSPINDDYLCAIFGLVDSTSNSRYGNGTYIYTKTGQFKNRIEYTPTEEILYLNVYRNIDSDFYPSTITVKSLKTGLTYFADSTVNEVVSANLPMFEGPFNVEIYSSFTTKTYSYKILDDDPDDPDDPDDLSLTLSPTAPAVNSPVTATLTTTAETPRYSEITYAITDPNGNTEYLTYAKSQDDWTTWQYYNRSTWQAEPSSETAAHNPTFTPTCAGTWTVTATIRDHQPPATGAALAAVSATCEVSRVAGNVDVVISIHDGASSSTPLLYGVGVLVEDLTTNGTVLLDTQEYRIGGWTGTTNGRVTLSAPLGHQIRITAQKDGYVTRTQTDYVQPTAVPLNQMPISIILSPATTPAPDQVYLTVAVTDLRSQPIQGATVSVGGRVAQTSAQGICRLSVPVNQTLSWSVKADGYHGASGIALPLDANSQMTVQLQPSIPATPGPGDPGYTPGATPTPDTRTNEQKGQAIIDLIADFAEPIALLAIVATVFGLMQMMMPRRR